MGPTDDTRGRAIGVLEALVKLEVADQLEQMRKEEAVEQSAGAIDDEPTETHLFNTTMVNNTVTAEIHGRSVRVVFTNPEGQTTVAYLSPAAVAYLEARFVEFSFTTER